MQINIINNNSYRNNAQINNQTSFKALKGIKYESFNPNKYIGDAKTMLAFKKSEPLKKFFEKYDGKVTFSTDYNRLARKNFANFEIKYNLNPVSPKKIEDNASKNPLTKFKNTIKGLFSKNKNNDKKVISPIPFELLTNDINNSSATEEMAKRIKDLKYEDLEKNILENKNLIKKLEQDAIRLQNIKKEIKEYL